MKFNKRIANKLCYNQIIKMGIILKKAGNLMLGKKNKSLRGEKENFYTNSWKAGGLYVFT